MFLDKFEPGGFQKNLNWIELDAFSPFQTLSYLSGTVSLSLITSHQAPKRSQETTNTDGILLRSVKVPCPPLFHGQEKLDEREEETHSDGDCGISSTTSSDRSPLRAPEDWTVDEVADWLWNLEGGKHRRCANQLVHLSWMKF